MGVKEAAAAAESEETEEKKEGEENNNEQRQSSLATAIVLRWREKNPTAVNNVVEGLVNVPSPQDMDGLGLQATPLHVASQRGNLECCKVLLQDGGADPSAQTSRGLTARAAAARNNFLQLAQLLASWERKKASKGGGGESKKSNNLVTMVDERLP